MIGRLRVPRWMLAIPALQPLLQRLHDLRVHFFPRVKERANRHNDRGRSDGLLQGLGSGGNAKLGELLGAAQSLLTQEKLEEAHAKTLAAVAEFPGEAESWRALGQIEYAIEKRQPAPSPGAAGHAAPWHSAQPLLQEDTSLLDMLARPAPSGLPDGSVPDGEAVRQLKALATSLASENRAFGLRLEPLHQQLGHRRDALETWIKYEHTKYYMRGLALYMRKYGDAPLPPAATTIPEPLKQGFAMNGAVPIQEDYLNAAYPAQYRDTYTDFDIQTFQRVWRGQPAASDHDRQCLIDFGLGQGETDRALQRFVAARIGSGSTVACVGSRGPVYEALCLAVGAHPTTVRQSPVDNRAAGLKTTTFVDWAKAPTAFDAAIAVSTVEQTGLGMHGDELDPDGDLKLMAILKRMVKPGGTLFLVLPTGPDCTVFNVGRVFGDVRLKRLLDGWTVAERHRHQEPMLHGHDEDRSLFVLVNAA